MIARFAPAAHRAREAEVRDFTSLRAMHPAEAAPTHAAVVSAADTAGCMREVTKVSGRTHLNERGPNGTAHTSQARSSWKAGGENLRGQSAQLVRKVEDRRQRGAHHRARANCASRSPASARAASDHCASRHPPGSPVPALPESAADRGLLQSSSSAASQAALSSTDGCWAVALAEPPTTRAKKSVSEAR